MSSIRKALCTLSGLLLLAGCSDSSNAGKIFSTVSGHTANWADPASLGTTGFHGSSVQVQIENLTAPENFGRRCAFCHNDDASGKVGPDIRGRPVSAIRAAVQVVEHMRWLRALSDQEIASIAEFLGSPSPPAPNGPFLEAVSADSCRQCHGQDFTGSIALIRCYSCHNGPDGTVGHSAEWATLKERPTVFHGTYGRDFVLACTTCHHHDLRGPRDPGCYLCHDPRYPISSDHIISQ